MWPLLKNVKHLIRSLAKPSSSSKQAGEKTKEEFENYPVTDNLSKRIDIIKEVMGNSIDVVIREIVIGNESNTRAAAVYLDGLVSNDMVHGHILRPLLFEAQSIQTDKKLSPKKVFKTILEKRLTAGEIMVKEKNSELFAHLVTGDTVILIDGHPSFIVVCTRSWEARGVEEPENESTVRGPREGFTETLKVNLSQVRRRIKTPHLRFDSLYIGSLTQTTVIIAYINNLVNPELVKEVRERLQRIDTDSILSSGYLEDFIQDNPYSPFPQLRPTERPDIVAAGLLEGRVAIMVDNTPFAYIAPSAFFEHLQAADDYYSGPWFGAILVRILRAIAFNIAILFPAVYVAVTTYHQELIPTPLMISIAGAREGVPFPAMVEAFLMESTFELLREAGLRLPSAIGTAVSIVGALVLGDAAIRAGIVSPAMVIVVATTAIASFALPGFAAALTLRILRFPLILLGGVLGLFGVMFGLLVILIHLSSLRSFGVPYMSPLVPLMPRDLKDIFGRAPQWAMSKRPRYLRTQEPVRQADNLKPDPYNKKRK